jgi:hypothetical protein
VRPTRSLIAASVVCALAASPVYAQQRAPAEEIEVLKRMMQEVISQNEDLKRRIQLLEAPKAKAEPAKAEPAAKEAGSAPTTKAPEDATQKAKVAEEPPKPVSQDFGWWNKIQLGGAVETEVRSERNKDFKTKSNESVFELKTAEFDFEANIVDWAKGKLAAEWIGPSVAGSQLKSTSPDADKLNLNEAYIQFGTDTSLFGLKVGRRTLPFGLSTGSTVAARLEDKLTVTDPLSLAVFDTKEDQILVEVRLGGLNVATYVFQGDTHRGVERRLQHYGGHVGYGLKTDVLSLVVGFSMIDSVFDSDGLQEKYPEALTAPYVPGIAANIRLGLFGFSLVTAYYGALRQAHFTRADQPVNIRPEAWSVEAGYTTELFSKKTYAALMYSQTADLVGAFPKDRSVGTLGLWLSNNIRLAAEYVYDHDYPTTAHAQGGPGGTGRTSETGLVRLTYEW